MRGFATHREMRPRRRRRVGRRPSREAVARARANTPSEMRLSFLILIIVFIFCIAEDFYIASNAMRRI